MSCSGLCVGGFSEQDGHGDEGDLLYFTYAASSSGGVTIS